MGLGCAEGLVHLSGLSWRIIDEWEGVGNGYVRGGKPASGTRESSGESGGRIALLQGVGCGL